MSDWTTNKDVPFFLTMTLKGREGVMSSTLARQINLAGRWEVALIEFYGRQTRSSKSPNFLALESDLVSSSLFHEGYKNLIALVPVKSGLSHVEFSSPRYVPLQKNSFNEVRINLLADGADVYDGFIGATVARLHFRPADKSKKGC